MSRTEVERIHAVWLKVDDLLRMEGGENAVHPVAVESRETNDCAYFVILFAQLEPAISELYEQTVGPAQRVPFFTQLGMVADLLEVDAEKLRIAYELRCEIAHGRITREDIQLPIWTSLFLEAIGP